MINVQACFRLNMCLPILASTGTEVTNVLVGGGRE